MPSYLTRGLQVAVDLSVLSAAYWLGFLFRFEFSIPSYWGRVGLITWLYVIAIEYAVLWLYAVPRYSWRFVSLREAARVGLALATSTAVLVTLRMGLHDIDGPLQLAVIPFGVIGSNLVVAFVGLVSARAMRRMYVEAKERKLREGARAQKRVLLIGAGQAGVLVARELAARPDLGLHPVGFIDDDRRKLGSRIGGLPVLGSTAKLGEIADRKRVDRLLITIANAPGDAIRRITMLCRDTGLPTQIIPGIYELVGNRVNLTRIRPVQVEDLLGREPVALDEAQLSDALRNEVVMVTGAGGSIGSELCRQACRFAPAKLVLVERFENALFEIHRELAALFPDLQIVPRIGDVVERTRMEQLFAEFRPSFVIHAAAHKHVPMMEMNPGEAVKNNIGGTRVVAELADKYGAARFVLVSTDKAVNPTSVMGATKRVAEIFTQSLGHRSKTRFVIVRFGNVLGSNGSVIPIFKEQIAKGGPVMVTHPDMRRYFMTIPEASQLVLQAGAMGTGGEVFILDMGSPVKIVDLARDLIVLSGLRPGDDIKIEFSGVRPGEKLFEELSTDTENADKTRHPKIFIGRVPAAGWEQTVRSLDEVLAATSEAEVRALLAKIVPEYSSTMAAPAAVSSERHDPPRATRRADTSGSGSQPAVP